MVRFESSTPWEKDDPRSQEFLIDLSEHVHTNGRKYIRFKCTLLETILSTDDARCHAESLRHFADILDGRESAPVPPPPDH